MAVPQGGDAETITIEAIVWLVCFDALAKAHGPGRWRFTGAVGAVHRLPCDARSGGLRFSAPQRRATARARTP